MPDPPETNGPAPKNRPEPKTRLERLNETGDAPLLPPNPAPYLTGWLFEIGPVAAAAMGEGAMRIADIAADLAALGVEALPWETKLLRRLSAEYASERYHARKQDRLPPYVGTVDEIAARRASVDRKIEAAFAGLKKKV